VTLRIENWFGELFQNVQKHASIVAQRLGFQRDVSTFVTCAVINVYVFRLELMATRKNVHVITIGNPDKENPSVPNSTILSTNQLYLFYPQINSISFISFSPNF